MLPPMNHPHEAAYGAIDTIAKVIAACMKRDDQGKTKRVVARTLAVDNA